MNFLGRVRVRAKLLLLMGLAVVGLVAMGAVSASLMQARMMQDRVNELRALVLTARGFAQYLEDQVQAKQISRADALKMFRDEVHRVRFGGKDDYFLVQDSQGMVVMHGGDPAREGKPTTARDAQGRSSAQLAAEALRHTDVGVIRYLVAKPGEKTQRLKVSVVARFGPWPLDLIAGSWVDDIEAAYWATIARLGLIGGMILVITLAAAWLINRDIAGSLGALQDAMSRLSRGDLGTDVAGTGRLDEIGAMAEAVQVFKDNAVTMERMKAEQQRAEAQAQEEKHRALERLAREFEANVASIIETVAAAAMEMREAASTMTSDAQEASRRTTAVAAASEQASANVHSVAAGAEELSVSVGEIAGRVGSSTEIALRAARESARTNGLVSGLADAAQKIGAVTH